MFKALVKTRFAALGASLFIRGGGNAKKQQSKLKMIGFALLMLYACFAFMMMFGIYFQQIAKPFFVAGIGWLYFTLFWMTAFAMMFIGSVFVAKSQLYEARDNDLLLSLPIPPRLILSSRMFMIMILNFFFELLVAIPAYVMWVRAVPADFLQIAAFIVTVLVLPFLSMAISCLFAWLLALTTGRIRNKSLITILFSVIFLGLYFFFFSQANKYIQELIMNGQGIAGSLGSVSPLFWVGNAIAEPNAVQLVFSILISLLPFVLAYCLLSATFIRVATAKRGAAKIRYEEKEMHASSASSALFGRELKRMLASPNYILNAGIGILFILAAAVALIIKRSTILSLIAQLGFGAEYVGAVAVLALCLFCCTILFSASSVSLEGKSLWVIKSLPVSSNEILQAKLHLHNYLTIPPILLAAAAAIFVIAPSVLDALLILIAPVFFVMLTSNIGLICNLKNPRFDWINEMQVVKQGISVLLSMLFSFLLVAVPGALYFVVLAGKINSSVFLVAFTLLLSGGWFVSRNWIASRGAEIFDSLN